MWKADLLSQIASAQISNYRQGFPVKLTNVVLVPPLEANSKVMRVEYPSFEECKKLFRLLRVKLVDILREGTHGVYALPSGDRISAHDRMDRREVCTNILWCTAGSFVYNNMFWISRSSFQEPIANERRCQALKEFAVWLGKSGRVVSRLNVDIRPADITDRSYSS